jgi:hypothetical protein
MESYYIEIRVMRKGLWTSQSKQMEVPEGMMDHVDWDHMVHLVMEELLAEEAMKQADEAAHE